MGQNPGKLARTTTRWITRPGHTYITTWQIILALGSASPSGTFLSRLCQQSISARKLFCSLAFAFSGTFWAGFNAAAAASSYRWWSTCLMTPGKLLKSHLWPSQTTNWRSRGQEHSSLFRSSLALLLYTSFWLKSLSFQSIHCNGKWSRKQLLRVMVAAIWVDWTLFCLKLSCFLLLSPPDPPYHKGDIGSHAPTKPYPGG